MGLNLADGALSLGMPMTLSVQLHRSLSSLALLLCCAATLWWWLARQPLERGARISAADAAAGTGL